MIAIHIDIVRAVLNNMDAELSPYLNAAKKNLIDLRDDTTVNYSAEESRYLNAIINDFAKIVYATPNELATYKASIGTCPQPSPAEKTRRDLAKIESLKDRIITAMRYGELRSKFYPRYFHKIGIKSCVYCNAHPAISIEPENPEDKTKAKFQVDHFIPKADYPSFCISFFNLYPVCAFCNLAKGIKPLSFQLYTDIAGNTKTSAFGFSLKPGCVAKFLDHRDTENISIIFDEPGKTDTKNGPFQTIFDIEGIYNTQKDLIEELILKAQVYTPQYKANLLNSFPKIFTNAALSNRVIIGNYTTPEDIHKRPMAKFTQDIAAQLGLL